MGMILPKEGVRPAKLFSSVLIGFAFPLEERRELVRNGAKVFRFSEQIKKKGDIDPDAQVVFISFDLTESERDRLRRLVGVPSKVVFSLNPRDLRNLIITRHSLPWD